MSTAHCLVPSCQQLSWHVVQPGFLDGNAEVGQDGARSQLSAPQVTLSPSPPILCLAAQLRGHPCNCGEGNGTPLQYSCLENPMDGGAWWAAVQGVAKSRTRLSNFTFAFHFPALEKEMATHSSVLAWRIPGTGEPGGLLSIGSQSWTRLKRLSSSSSSHAIEFRPCAALARDPKAGGG